MHITPFSQARNCSEGRMPSVQDALCSDLLADTTSADALRMEHPARRPGASLRRSEAGPFRDCPRDGAPAERFGRLQRTGRLIHCLAEACHKEAELISDRG